MNIHRSVFALLCLTATLIQILMPVYSAYAQLEVRDEQTEIQTLATAIASVDSAIANDITATDATANTFWQRVLNVAAYAAINIVLQTITRQIIGWIQGKDSGFVQNLQAEVLRTTDAEVGGLLADLIPINLCGNIGAFLKLSLGAPTVSLRQRMQCSVTGIVGNFQNFYDNFANGGWPAFFSISLEPQNNAYGAFLLAANVQAERQDGKRTNLLENLKYGNGFEGFKVARDTNCRAVSPEQKDEMERFIQIQQQTGGKPIRAIRENTSFDPEVSTGSGYDVCDVAYDTKTPGKLFADALPAAAFSGLRRTELATQIDQGIAQIITALLKRIIQESVSGGEGLFGSRDLGTDPQTTLTEAGFNTTYITNKTDDLLLRLEASALLLDTEIQDLDTKIAAIDAQIVAPQKICTDTPSLCDQKQIDKLNADKAPLEEDRTTQITLLTSAQSDLSKILDLRTQLLTTTDVALLENYNTKLIGIQDDAEQIIQQAGGPPVGQNGVDANDDFVKIADNARDRAAAIIAYLEKLIAAETDGTKKTALEKARDDLKKLSADLDLLRTDFLAAIADEAPTADIMTDITDKIGAVNDEILSAYAL